MGEEGEVGKKGEGGHRRLLPDRLPTYHSIRAGRAVYLIGRDDPNRSTFSNQVLRGRCAGREYDRTSLEAPGLAWGREVLGCLIQPLRGAT